jgi:DNA-binding NarL/FixJ family response regulator
MEARPHSEGYLADQHSPSYLPGGKTAPAAVRPAIAYVDPRCFIRDGVVRSLVLASGLEVEPFNTIQDWRQAPDRKRHGVLLISQYALAGEGAGQTGYAALLNTDDMPPVAILADTEVPDQVVMALNQGIRGFVPTTLASEVVVQALLLVMAGGVYAPAASLMSARHLATLRSNATVATNDMFTSRQAAVIEAIRRGKSNKVIAYELNMCESTVKVHVRNLMKKLKAKNRTELAYLAGDIMGPVRPEMRAK